MRIKQQRVTKTSAAYSLVEACVAMAILAIFVVSAYASLSAWFSTTAIAREDLRATQIMLEKTETLRLYNWSQLPITNFTTTEFYNYKDKSGFTYAVNVDVAATTNITESYSNLLRVVTVKVNWTNGVPRSREMKTLVSQYGMHRAFLFN